VTDSRKLILFEPWNMGDALIAAAIALQDPTRLTLACNSRWHPLIRATAEGIPTPNLISTNLDYVNRGRTGRWSTGPLTAISSSATDVATIRGDIRDYRAAKKLFPNAAIHSNGWLPFAARRSAFLNAPFANGWLPIRNRYRAWAEIASVPWQQVEHFYQQKLPEPSAPLITIHIGAQWRSRQYPHVAKLASLLALTGPVQIVAGPDDPLPTAIAEVNVRRLMNQDLIDAFRLSTHVIVNDSGPMHLAALLRCRTHPIARMSAIAEWLPPATVAIESKATPKGYRPHRAYMSDTIVEGWPSPEAILHQLESS
jgi:pimeloyl-ACP methyl ester carboxylesterase